jgi:hypothetical protein
LAIWDTSSKQKLEKIKETIPLISIDFSQNFYFLNYYYCLNICGLMLPWLWNLILLFWKPTSHQWTRPSLICGRWRAGRRTYTIPCSSLSLLMLMSHIFSFSVSSNHFHPEEGVLLHRVLLCTAKSHGKIIALMWWY